MSKTRIRLPYYGRVGSKKGILIIVLISGIIEWVRSWHTSRGFCGGANEIIQHGLFLGKTCIWYAGEILSDGVNAHSIDQGYWYGSTLDIFLRNKNSMLFEYSIFHAIMVCGLTYYILLTLSENLKERRLKK